MPSEWHDAFVNLVKEKPKFAATVLREIMGVDLPADAPVWPAPEVLNDRPSNDMITDKMIIVGTRHDPLRVIIVEVQATESDSKRRQIPRYAMAAWLWYKCPVDVIVFCPDEETAQWYATPLPTAQEDCLYRPKSVLPSRVPAVTDPEAVAANPAVGMLSVVYHGQDRRVSEAFAAGIADLGPEKGESYYEYANVLAPENVRKILEVIVTTTQTPRYSEFAKRHYAEGEAAGEAKAEARYSEFAKRHYAEGEARGEARGERHTVRMVARARGLSLSDKQSKLIDDCDDLATLQQWSQNALTATDPDEIFK